jgi:hypothetical protein
LLLRDKKIVGVFVRFIAPFRGCAANKYWFPICPPTMIGDIQDLKMSVYRSRAIFFQEDAPRHDVDVTLISTFFTGRFDG